MHTPFCPPLAANMETVILPSRDQIKTVASGVGVASGVVVPQNRALVVMSPNAEVDITIPIAGAPNDPYVLSLKRGNTRVILPASLQYLEMTGSCTDVWQAYIEDLAAFKNQAF